MSVGSIPSKFETIVYKNTNNKAFGSSELRFSSAENDMPGPGYYPLPSQSVIISGEKESLSKKGYGNGFASSSERNPFSAKYLNCGPGPGSYTGESSLMSHVTSTSSIKGTLNL